MNNVKPGVILSALTGLLALFQAGAGLLWGGGDGPFSFTTLHNQTVQMYGQGLYQFDTAFKAPILRGTDAMTLCVSIPLLVVSLFLTRRGSLRGRLLLAGVLSYFVYNTASLALGAAYNPLFLLYVANFSASLFAFGLVLGGIDRAGLVGPGAPRRSVAALLFVTGAALLVLWLSDILGPLFSGGLPNIASYTTEVTYVFDLGIIAPLCLLSGVLVLRRASMGYLLASILLVMLVMVGVMVLFQTGFQLQAGVSLTPGQIAGYAGSFVLLAAFAIGLLRATLSHVQA